MKNAFQTVYDFQFLLVLQPAVVTDSPPKYPGIIFFYLAVRVLLVHDLLNKHPKTVVECLLWFDVAFESSPDMLFVFHEFPLHCGGSLSPCPHSSENIDIKVSSLTTYIESP